MVRGRQETAWEKGDDAGIFEWQIQIRGLSDRPNDALSDWDVDEWTRRVAELERKKVIIFSASVIAVHPCKSASTTSVVDGSEFGVDGFDGRIFNVGVRES